MLAAAGQIARRAMVLAFRPPPLCITLHLIHLREIPIQIVQALATTLSKQFINQRRTALALPSQLTKATPTLLRGVLAGRQLQEADQRNHHRSTKVSAYPTANILLATTEPPPPSPQYHDSRRHPHATAADWSSGARCAPPSSDFLEHGRNPQMDVLQPNTHRGGKQASTSFAARAREFLGRDKSNPASPVRDGVVPSTEGFEGLGFDDTQAFLERQRANGNGSMVNESIVGFEPQYAQPNAGRANVAGSPSAARRAPPYSAEPYVAEQVAAAAPAAIHGRLQEQLYHRGRIASADVPGPPHHPHRHFDSDVTARPPHSPLKPHQSPGRPSPEDNNHYFSEYPGHRDPYLDRIAPIAHNSQHIPHTAAGFAVEHFPDLAVPSLHSTFATSSFIPQVPASANEWCR